MAETGTHHAGTKWSTKKPLIIERRTATPQRQKETNKELTKRYNLKYNFLKGDL